MQNTIAQLREEKAALTASALSQQQTQNIVGQLRPTAVPAYPSCSPYQAYTWGQVFGGGCCNNGCGCNNDSSTILTLIPSNVALYDIILINELKGIDTKF